MGERWIGKLMDCFNCLSLWIAAPAALFVTLRPVEWLFSWLALSGAACLLERVTQAPAVIDSIRELEEGETHHVLWKETHDDPDGNTSGTGNFGLANGSQHAGTENRRSLH
jgi:hypothetical protein